MHATNEIRYQQLLNHNVVAREMNAQKSKTITFDGITAVGCGRDKQ